MVGESCADEEAVLEGDLLSAVASLACELRPGVSRSDTDHESEHVGWVPRCSGEVLSVW